MAGIAIMGREKEMERKIGKQRALQKMQAILVGSHAGAAMEEDVTALILARE
jgi:hypothetical protein